MKCEYCNNEVQPGVALCPACGAPAPAANVISTPVAPTPRPAKAPTPTSYAAPVQPSVVVVNSAPPAPVQPIQPTYLYPYPPKSRLTYIFLAFFFGWLGIHNFYAKRSGSGITQLLITILSFGYLAVVSELWSLIEILAVDKDGNNVPFK